MINKIKEFILENILIWPFLLIFHIIVFVMRTYERWKIKLYRTFKIKHVIHKDKFYEYATRIKNNE
jgi:hypothetical protein